MMHERVREAGGQTERPDNALLGAEFWNQQWRGWRLPAETKPSDLLELHHLFERHLPRGERDFLEVGCAPGGFMAYFHRNFGYRVSGIEWGADGVRVTQENMKMLGVPANVLHGDFLAPDAVPGPFDVVFSAGFVEHFRDPHPVIERAVQICRPGTGYVVTTVPNLVGATGWVLKTFQPAVFAGHVVVSVNDLVAMHERCGLETVFADAVGGFSIARPLTRQSRFVGGRPLLLRLLNSPVSLFNKGATAISRLTNWYPRSMLLSLQLAYIGRRKD